MVDALKANSARPVLDFVPNHMGVGGADNVWWLDVLEWGPDSARAGYFDIDWEPGARYLQGKLLTPFLGKQYGQVLEEGGLELRFDADAGSFAVWACRTHKLPICPLDYDRILGDAHPELERIRGRVCRTSSHRPGVVRRANDLKAELAGLAAEGGRWPADAVLQAVGSFNTDTDRLHVDPARRHWRPHISRLRPMTSTIAVFSTSTSSPACAWSSRNCSTSPTASCSKRSATGRSTDPHRSYRRSARSQGLLHPLAREGRAAILSGGRERFSRAMSICARTGRSRHDQLRVRQSCRRTVRRSGRRGVQPLLSRVHGAATRVRGHRPRVQDPDHGH